MAALVERVLAIGWDGMRPDLVTPERTPNLHRLIERGVRWANASAAFPSETRPNNATIGTGCYPGAHGITANHMWVDELGDQADFDTGIHHHLFRLGELRGRIVDGPSLGRALAATGRQMAAIGSGSPGQTLLQNPDPEGGWVVNPGVTRPEELAFAIPIALGRMPSRHDPTGAGDDYLMRVAFEHAPTDLAPALTILWSNVPDGPLHTHGLGSPEADAAIRTNDARLGRILEQALAPDSRTAFLFMSDHGHSTVRRRVDLADELVRAGLKESRGSSDATAVGVGVRLSATAADRLPRLVAFLREQEWCGPIFVRDDRWDPSLTGTLPVSVLWGGAPGRDVPDVQFSYGWDDEPNEHGVPGRADASGKSQSSHGSLCPRDMRNLLVLAGPGIRSGLTFQAPAGTVDVAPTLLYLLGIAPPAEMQGRPLLEAFDGVEPPVQTELLLEDRGYRLTRRTVGRTQYVTAD
jgi:arylsulfatase A-like enzyme